MVHVPQVLALLCVVVIVAAQMDEHKAQLLKINKAEVASLLTAVNDNRQGQIQVAPSYATNEPSESSFSDESTDYNDDLQAVATLRNQDGMKAFKTGLDDNLMRVRRHIKASIELQ